MTEQRLAKLTQATRLTPVALQEKGRTRIGVAVPGKEGTTDLYLAQGYTETRDLAELTALMQQFLPAILGVLEMNRLACEGAGPARADMSSMLNVLAAESADLILQNKGTLASSQKVERGLVKTGDIRSVMHVVHHEKNDAQWQSVLRPQVEQAGGMERIEARRGLSESDLATLRAVEVEGIGMQVDTTKDNLLVVQAFANNVQPRLEASGLQAEDLVKIFLDAEPEHEPVREVLHRASGVATKKQWNVR